MLANEFLDAIAALWGGQGVVVGGSLKVLSEWFSKDGHGTGKDHRGGLASSQALGACGLQHELGGEQITVKAQLKIGLALGTHRSRQVDDQVDIS